MAVDPDVEELVAAPAQAVVVCSPDDPTGELIDVARAGASDWTRRRG